MKGFNENTKAVLAGEYVLGLLQGETLISFKKDYADNISLQEEVLFWEEYLFGLAEALESKRPPERVWKNISRRIETEEKVSLKKFGFEFWKGFALASVLSMLLAFFVLNNYTEQISIKDYVAILEDQQSQPVLIAKINRAQNALILEVLKPVSHSLESDLQVWCLPKTNEPPISMGLLSRNGVTRFELTAEEMALLKDARALAVSVEPKGGSEQPTGSIVYSGLSI